MGILLVLTSYVEVILKNSLLLLLIYVSSLSNAFQRPYPSLFDAVKLGSKKLTLYQLHNHANPNQLDELGNSPLHWAASIASGSITDLLLFYHANPNIRNKKGQTALHVATQRGCYYITRRLLLYGADPNIQDAAGNTPLHLAAGHAHQESATNIASALITYNADSSITNNNEQRAHMIALQTKHGGSLNNRKNMNIKRFIATITNAPLQSHRMHILNKHYIQCAKTDNIKAIQRISKYQTIHKNLPYGKHQRTALMYAARNNRTLMVDYLVNQLHVDKTIKDRYGKTAWDYAQKHKNSKLNALLGSVS